MYDFFLTLATKPEAFSASTIKTLWTQPHLAAQMLKYHLNDSTPLASRPLSEIKDIVAFINGYRSLQGLRVCDLGCGPGLYSNEFAACGAEVVGIDFSQSSIDYALSHRASGTSFQVADYLEDELPAGFDMACLIYTDFCSLSPRQRAHLLGKIRAMLKPGGLFILDVNSVHVLEGYKEETEIAAGMMGGFWSAGEYVGIRQEWLYPQDDLSLTRFTIVEPDQAWAVYNWRQCYTVDSIRAELARNGFRVPEVYGDLKGAPVSGASALYGVFAEPV